MPDLTTLLAKFLNDLYAGTLGVTQPISAVTLTDAGTVTIGTTSPVSLSRGAADVLALATGDSLNLVSGSLRLANVVAMSSTAPTVTSAGTSPSIAANGTASFRVNVGTGGTATTIVLAMPAATTGWNAFAENITGAAANRTDARVVVQSSTTTSLTLQYQTVSTGVAKAFTASDIVSVIAMAY